MDTAKKAKTLRVRRLIRSQLVGAPRLVAQTGLEALRGFLSGGDPGVLEGIRLGDRLSVAEVLKLLGGAPPLTVLKLLYATGGEYCVGQLDKVLAELDFVQSVVDLVGKKTELNPPLAAVPEAFRRRQLSGAFVSVGHNVNVDALLPGVSVHTEDSVLLAPDVKKLGEGSKNQRSASSKRAGRNICWPYQQGECRWRNCRFEHRCSFCNVLGHGFYVCRKKGSSGRGSRGEASHDGRRDGTPQVSDGPPNPRSRSSRN